MSALKKAAFSALVIVSVLFVHSPVVAYSGELQKIGSGVMKWHFLELYDATFFASSAEKFNEYPATLKLEYSRNIKAKHLVSATRKEWKRMNVQHRDKSLWLNELTAIWPDVNEGDVLECRVDVNGSAAFYFNGQYIGEIKSAEFSNSFLAIWMSERARNQKLRNKLIGLGG